ncbi:5-methylcytosine-specific restriction endonuclease McrA [Pseudarthrobacter oxydans]|uniref:HNH endonuclease n=1 Tax=Pseudarthrobacter oxydans TaxID=1671 RepID=UPI0027840CC7|nr:HNH endonuclease signature motif containing protein [Pseudarthrobacter oxydans]MDP9982964.1 5-methylcytosine-specific restriction endonuclease McrA [Pseudarthrobacter oxydans]
MNDRDPSYGDAQALKQQSARAKAGAEVNAALTDFYERLSSGPTLMTDTEFAAMRRSPSTAGNVGNRNLKTWTMDDSERLPKVRRRAVILLHERDKGICAICHTSVALEFRLPHPASASIDHKVLTSFGGPDIWGNVQLVHLQCNMERGTESVGALAPSKAFSRLERAIHKYERPGRLVKGLTPPLKVCPGLEA